MLSCSRAFCQNDEQQKSDWPSTSLGVSVGINGFHQWDKYLSPSTFDGVNFASQLSFLTSPMVGLVSRLDNGHRLSQNNIDVVDKDFLNAATQGKIEYLWSNFVLSVGILWSI